MSWFCSHPDCENVHSRDTVEPTMCEACELRDEIDRLRRALGDANRCYQCCSLIVSPSWPPAPFEFCDCPEMWPTNDEEE